MRGAGMTMHASAPIDCPFCNRPAPQLYVLPPRATRGRRAAPACYFCFLRLAGIKPNRRHLAPPSGAQGDAPGAAVESASDRR